MPGFLDLSATVLLFLAIITLYVVVPLALSYYLLRKKWMNDRLKTFFGAVLLVDIIGYIVLIILR